jgi:Rod binding domain-containing protein
MLSPISTASLPADIRAGTPQEQNKYKTAVGFEQMLVGQLVKSMVGQDGPLADGDYATQMQDSLTTALTGGSGFGLAQQIYKEMRS